MKTLYKIYTRTPPLLKVTQSQTRSEILSQLYKIHKNFVCKRKTNNKIQHNKLLATMKDEIHYFP